MGAIDDLLASEEFRGLPESEQVSRLSRASDGFAAAYRSDPGAAMELLRSRTGKPQEERSAVGEVIRQFGSGLGESFTDVAQLPFDAAEWVASAAGSEWRTGVDDAIEAWSQKQFPEATTPEGRVARAVGHGVGLGVQVAATGGALGALGGATRVGQAGRLLSGGLGVEVAAGGVGEGAGQAVSEVTDNPWLAIGAGILAGGATGVGIAARTAMRRSASEAEKAAAEVLGESAAARAARDAVESATTDEMKRMGIDPRVLDGAHELDAQRTLERFVQGTHAQMEPEKLRNITQATGKVLEEAGFEYDPSHTLISQLARLIEDGTMPRQQVQQILEGFGTSLEEIWSDELADAFLKTGKEAGRALNIFSQEAKRLRANAAWRKKQMGRALTKEEERALREVGGPNGEGLSFWRRMENARRGLLVTQLSTAMRNFETQIGNLGIHALEDSMEAGLLKLFPRDIRKAHPTNALGTLFRLGESIVPGRNRTKTQVQAIQELFPKQMDPLFARYAADILANPGHGPVRGLEKGVLYLNAANRLQEYGIRRAAFTAELDRILSAKGQSLDALEKAGKLGSLSRDDVTGAVERALELTWGSEFHSGMDGAAGIAGNLIDAINRIGIGPFRATQVIPFPRFMANSIRWQFQHSPLPLMKYLYSPQAWRNLLAGDVKDVVRATTGTGLFLSAHQVRNSEWAGERWHEIRPPDDVASALGMEPGSTIDLRPFNPFASYLFAADIVKRMRDGTLNTFTTRDVAMGFMATNLRAGAGLYILDEFLDTVSQSFQNPEGMQEALGQIGEGLAGFQSAAWSGMLVPLQQLRDVVSSFDESQQVVRDSNVAPIAGEFLRKIPYADESLPEVELPTRSGPPRSGAGTGEFPFLGEPIGRQLTGFAARGPKSAGERELDRLGFSRGELLPSTGVDEWDRLMSKNMGPLFEQYVNPFVASEDYQQLGDEERGVVLQKLLQRVRTGARRLSASERPDLYAETKEGRMSRRMQRLMAARQSEFLERRDELERTRRRQ